VKSTLKKSTKTGLSREFSPFQKDLGKNYWKTASETAKILVAS